MQHRLLLAFILIGSALTGCGFPAYELSPLEKRADIEWVYGVFERNYAPAEWKQNQFGTSLAQAKQNCLDESEKISRADDFIAHLGKCVNRFQDAHTRTFAGGMVLPEFAKVAYLGFTTKTVRVDLNNPPEEEKEPKKESSSGKRGPVKPAQEKRPSNIQYALLVEQYLPTTETEDYPVKIGDYILEVNGRKVIDQLNEELVPFGNLGQAEASLSVAGQLFPLRSSFNTPLPTTPDAQFKILRGGRVIQATLPWTVKDALQFQNEQSQANARKNAGIIKADRLSQKHSAIAFRWDGEEVIDQMLGLFNRFRTQAGNRVSLLLQNTFNRHNLNPTLHFVNELLAEGQEATDQIPVETALGDMMSLKVDNSVFAARVFVQEDGSRIGYVRLETFSLDDTAGDKLSEVHAKFEKLKVKGVIYDALDNGGGSLVAGLRMVNTLAEKPLQYPKMQLALNDNWLNAFHADALYGSNSGRGSDGRRTLSERVYNILIEDKKAGSRISRPISSTELDPFVLTADKNGCRNDGKCLGNSVKRVLLVNEMCASMCDIFASAFRDNQLGTIIGSQTMGAGGNVVIHGSSPVSQILLNQTESLIVDVKGEYLENRGVIPDVPVDTILDRASGFYSTYAKAVEVLNQ
jgi:C-terminal processing protease CtpA/Prc